MLLMYIKYTLSTSVSCIPFNDIYHKLAKMTLCFILNVDKYHFKIIQGYCNHKTFREHFQEHVNCNSRLSLVDQ